MLGLVSPPRAAMERTYTEPIGGSARAVPPWRALAAAALLSLLVGAAFSGGLAATSESVLPAPRSGPSSQARLPSLPSAAQGSISAALGAVDHAYWVSASGSGYRALSPSQALHIRFGRSRVALSAGRLQLGLSLRAAGYGRALTAVGDVAPSVRANRVTYAHAGLTEWYVNGPQGLEQGFTVPRPPVTHPAGALTLSMALSGDAHASLSAGGRTIIFKHGASALRYTALTATDATGRTLHSWLKLRAGQLKLSVDTRGARYPVTVDPLVQHNEKLTAADGSKSLAGFSVALSADGNTALIGAPRDHNFAGAALVFTRSGLTWTPQPTVLVGSEQGSTEEPCAKEPEESEEEGEPGCGFGSSVALSADGNTALIGGQRDNGYVGAAWVFTRSSATATWSQQGPKLTGGEEAGSGRFGRSVALSADGNTALVGGPVDHLGAAWVFTRSGSTPTWSQQGPKLTGGEGAGSGAGQYFGASVVLSADGNTALIGDPGDSGHVGAAWVFARSGSTPTWSQQGPKLTGESEESGEGRFGFSVALSSDASTALIGARNDNAGAGAAWAFTRSGSTWTQQGVKLTGGEEANGQPKFGYSVALSATGETALIGGRGDSGHRGAAWMFTRSGAAWSQQEGKLTGGGEVGAGNFGASVALSADAETALVGGPTDNGKVGAAWAFADLPVPTVTNVSPNEGPSAGGTEVVITGTKLDTATAVRFGSEEHSRQARSFTINSPTSITAVSPRGTGRADVIVSNSYGDSRTSERDLFTYISLGGKGLRPAVTSVVPDHGPTAGGTHVTITGANLGEASAVRFGRAGAASNVTDISATEITAVSPPGQPETVSVTVTTPAGNSSASPGAQFTFETPNPLSSTGSAGNVGASGGALGFGPFVVSSCTVALRGKTIAVQSYKRASVKLSWAGIGTCKGRLKLTVQRKISHPRRGHKRFTITTIGTGAFSIAPGAVRTVRVDLNALGRALLKARHGRLNASIAITKLSPGPAQARTASVRLALAKPHKAKKRTK
ncbi:MAG: IPT/TIG domain-containing protein [Solirubrobacterales bacterium]